MQADKILLEIRNLKICFDTYEGVVQAIDGINLTVFEDETLGIVGETGCGKSITSMAVLNLVPPSGRIESGEIWFEGENLLTKNNHEIQMIRGSKISMIFQDPMVSLNPVFTIGDQITTVLHAHRKLGQKEARQAAIEVFKQVRLPDAEQMLDKYPHELSGGMLQRVMIGMSLTCRPRLLIADEPTTALDVTIQAQILRLMRDLKGKMQTAVMLITHDLGVVARVCQRVAVMYAGQIVEIAEIKSLFQDPKHPYTMGLLSTIPRPGHRGERLHIIQGRVPALINPPRGCRFHPRCTHALEVCAQQKPEMVEISPSHLVACYLYSAL